MKSNYKRVGATLVAAVALAGSMALPALASSGSFTFSYSNQGPGWWSQKWWDNDKSPGTIKLTHVNGCSATTVTYRAHRWNSDWLPATSLGDHEVRCTKGASSTWRGHEGNHEYRMQIVGVNGQGSGSKASAKESASTTEHPCTHTSELTCDDPMR